MLKDGVLRVHQAMHQIENALIVRRLQQVVADQQSFRVLLRRGLQPLHQARPRIYRNRLECNRICHVSLLPFKMNTIRLVIRGVDAHQSVARPGSRKSIIRPCPFLSYFNTLLRRTVAVAEVLRLQG